MRSLLSLAFVLSSLGLVFTPQVEAARRGCCCAGGTASAPVVATAQAGSGYRTYSYEPGSSESGMSTYTRPVDRSFRDATFKASGRQN